MKVSLKSKNFDLDIDGVEKLDDVLTFVERFFDLEAKARASKPRVDQRASASSEGRPRTRSRASKQPQAPRS